MAKMVLEQMALYEEHYERMLQRVACRRAMSLNMAWLFKESYTLPFVPDYLEFHVTGRNSTERLLNQFLFRLSRNIWFRLFWPKIRDSLMSYMRTTYFPIFFEKTSGTSRIEMSQQTALDAIKTFMSRQWDNLGLCTFSEVGIMVNEILKTCYSLLDCPEDLFAAEKQEQNRACLELLRKDEQYPWPHSNVLDFMVYRSCQSNWIDSLEGNTARTIRDMEEECRSMLTDPGRLDDLGRKNPYYRIDRFRDLISGKPKRILFECDNCGELVFDMRLIQHLVETGHSVVLGAKARPALNDATIRDVEDLLRENLFAPLNRAMHDGRLSLLPIDSVMGGKLLYEASDQYKNAYEDADLLILKGQGNFQTMPMGIRGQGRFIPCEYRKPVVFLMPVKSVMSRLCLHAVMKHPPEDRSLLLYCYDPSDSSTYPQ